MYKKIKGKKENESRREGGRVECKRKEAVQKRKKCTKTKKSFKKTKMSIKEINP